MHVLMILATPDYGYERNFRLGENDALAVFNGGGSDDGVGHEGEEEDGDDAGTSVSVNIKSTANREGKENDVASADATGPAAAITEIEAEVAGDDKGERTARKSNWFVQLVARVENMLWKPAREWKVDEMFAGQAAGGGRGSGVRRLGGRGAGRDLTKLLDNVLRAVFKEYAYFY